MRNLLQDLRYGMRGLVKNPGFTLVVTLILGLAIGANSVLFSFVNLLLLRKLPIQEIEQVAFIEGRNAEQGAERLRLSPADFLDYRERSKSLEGLAAYTLSSATLTGRGEPELLTTGLATASFFGTWGLRADRGRTFSEAEDRAGGPAVALLSHGAWTRRFGADPALVGRTLMLNSRPHEVVGVLTPEIEVGSFGTIEVWLPLALERSSAARSDRRLRVTGRLAPGSTVTRAAAEVAGIARQLQQEHPDTNAGFEAGVLPARESLMGGRRSLLIFTLLGIIVAGVLAVACANVANLVLSRGVVRRRELAIRSAIGASSGRILRQLLAEGALLGAAGGIAGLAVAWVVMRVIRAAGHEPIFALIVVEPRVVLFAAVLSLLTPLAFGVWPALHALRDDAGKALRETGGRGAADVSGKRARVLLVVSQLALACALVTGASLLVRSARAMIDQDWGFDTRPLVTFRFDLPRERYADAPRVRGFHERLLGGLRGLPGAVAAGAIEPLPILGGEPTLQLDVPGREAARPLDRPWSVVFHASEGALEALGLPLLRGRSFDARDAAADVAVVSRAFAETYFGGEEPVGRWFGVYAEGGGEPRQVVVVGVTGDLRSANSTEPRKPTLFLPMDQGLAARASVVLRTQHDPRGAIGAVRAQIRGADPDLAVLSLAPLQQLRLENQASDEVISGMFGAFALVALLMAAMGLYASMAYLVSQRTQEIGIRMALGASGRGVVAMVLAEGGRLGSMGVAIGLALGFAMARAMTSLLYGVSATDPATYAAVAAVMVVVALVASAVPAWRATRVDPIRTLKAE